MKKISEGKRGLRNRRLYGQPIGTPDDGGYIAAQSLNHQGDKAVWTIPAMRMKAGQEHRIPLTARALAILKSLPKVVRNEHVFPGNSKGKPLSSMAMTMQLRRMKRGDITVHGFRSTFRDWASEQTSFPHQTCEHALAHRISDKAEAAYRRGDQFEKRRKLMEAWAAFCEPRTSAKIVPMKKTR